MQNLTFFLLNSIYNLIRILVRMRVYNEVKRLHFQVYRLIMFFISRLFNFRLKSQSN